MREIRRSPGLLGLASNQPVGRFQKRKVIRFGLRLTNWAEVVPAL